MREVTVFLHSQKIYRRPSIVLETVVLYLRRGAQLMERHAHRLVKFWLCDQVAPVLRPRLAEK